LLTLGYKIEQIEVMRAAYHKAADELQLNGIANATSETLALKIPTAASTALRFFAWASSPRSRRSGPTRSRTRTQSGSSPQRAEHSVRREAHNAPSCGIWLLLPNLETEIIRRSDRAKGFVRLPKRWIVERTIAWLNRCRRLAKDWENLNRNALAFVKLASIRFMLRKLCNP
jgi:transposase